MSASTSPVFARSPEYVFPTEAAPVGVVLPRASSSKPPGASAPSPAEKDIVIFPDALASCHPARSTVPNEIFFNSIHSAVADDGDPIHAISLKMICRVGADGAADGNAHGAAAGSGEEEDAGVNAVGVSDADADTTPGPASLFVAPAVLCGDADFFDETLAFAGDDADGAATGAPDAKSPALAVASSVGNGVESSARPFTCAALIPNAPLIAVG